MTDKKQSAIDAVFIKIPEPGRNLYRSIAEYAISLGYMPKLSGKDGGYNLSRALYRSAEGSRRRRERCSEESSFVTQRNIVIDGGYGCHR
jgi:hypothetical protein